MPTGTYIVSGGEEPSDGCLMLKSNVYLYGDGNATTGKCRFDGLGFNVGDRRECCHSQ